MPHRRSCPRPCPHLRLRRTAPRCAAAFSPRLHWPRRRALPPPPLCLLCTQVDRCHLVAKVLELCGAEHGLGLERSGEPYDTFVSRGQRRVALGLVGRAEGGKRRSRGRAARLGHVGGCTQGRGVGPLSHSATAPGQMACHRCRCVAACGVLNTVRLVPPVLVVYHCHPHKPPAWTNSPRGGESCTRTCPSGDGAPAPTGCSGLVCLPRFDCRSPAVCAGSAASDVLATGPSSGGGSAGRAGSGSMSGAECVDLCSWSVSL